MKGFIYSLIGFFIGSFLLMRLFSPWAKTYWRKEIIIASIQALVFSIFLVTISSPHSNHPNNIPLIMNALGRNTSELTMGSAITLTALASDPNENVIKLGIRIDHTKGSDSQVKQVVESYLSKSAELTNESDWKKWLLPYTFKLEEIGDSHNGRLIAEKHAGQTEFTWFEYNNRIVLVHSNSGSLGRY